MCKTEKIIIKNLIRKPTKTGWQKSCPQIAANMSQAIKSSNQVWHRKLLFSTLAVCCVEKPSVKMTEATNLKIRIELAIAVK